MSKFKAFTTFIVFLIIISSCNKDEIPKPEPDSRYPYTYKVLSQNDWEQRNSEFESVNNHDSLYINEYGFLEGKIFLNEDDSIGAELVIQQTELLIETYGTFMGIPDGNIINVPEDLTANDWSIGHGQVTDVYHFFNFVVPHSIIMGRIYAELYGNEYNPGPFSYYFFIPQNEIGDSDLKSTRLGLYFAESDKSIEIYGNWYPDVYIPEEQIYSKEEALKIAVEAFDDNVDRTIWSENKDGSSVRTNMTIYPLRIENKIELREVWDIRVQVWTTGMYHQIFIDTQTGEIIKKWSDVIPH